MDPVLLHFNVFQNGSPTRTSLQVDDPRGTTILDLKKQLYSEEIKASKVIRFIAAGKILQDASPLEGFKLGKEAHIHVSITDGPGAEASSSASATTAVEANASSGNRGSMMAILAGVSVFTGSGVMFYVVLQKRRQYSMNTSQLLFICMAVWVYVLLFHGLPALFQALNKMGSSTESKDISPRAVAVSSVASPAGVGLGDEATSGAASASTASPASATSSPGLSLMTPTLPPGDATTASVLTQRR